MNQPQPAFATRTNDALMARRHAAMPRGVGQSHNVFIERAKNSEIWDVEGRRHIDFAGGIAVLNTGHNHPTITAAVQAQVERFSHTCFQVVAYESYVELAEKLNAKAPGNAPKKTMLLSTGAEAVENAVKIARAFTGRPGIIAFTGAFHGRTNLTMGLTGKVAPYKTGFGPFTGELFHARFPNALHGVSVQDALDSVQQLLKHDIDPARTAAFILEPVQGEGGFVPAPQEFIAGLKAIADEHGILIIADEVQTGAGRTGTWYASEQWPAAPDLITTAKSLAGGYPLAAVTGRADIMDAPIVGGLGGTYAGNPVAVAAALAVIQVFEDEKLLDRAQHIGQRMRSHLEALAQQHKAIVEVRGPGAMVAFEICKDGNPQQPDAEATKRICAEAAKRGLILLSCGTYGNAVRLLMPLTIEDSVLDEGLAIISDSVAAALAA
ncbi:MAG: 4-aminobutyrate--2-oxoglutarate transaminase [Comamonas sp.]|nr:4-aminobutyrate--2-oxoglutarate transaminase [Comamonas sp.]